MSEKKVVTRFAPSPTGFMHVGGVRTALFAYLYAKKTGGKFLLRIEDTDKEREVDGSVEHIKKSLRYILQNPETPKSFPSEDELSKDSNNPWDGFYTQSERLPVYLAWAKKLTEEGFAYFDPYTKAELDAFRQKAQDEKRPFLFRDHRPQILINDWDSNVFGNQGNISFSKPLRFKISEVKKTEWQDDVRGDLSAGPEALDDFILVKTDGYPTYNFCHIVDDIEMEVTHVMRGEEFVSSTPKFLALYKALKTVFPEKKIELPKFVTLPPILGETGTKKLSKRDGAKDVLDYHKEGFIPEALANFLAFQGWNPGGEKELYETKELINSFSLERVQKSGARWNPIKLDWFNKEYMNKLNQNLFEDSSLVLEFEKYLPEKLLSKLNHSNDGVLRGQVTRSIAFWTFFERYMERLTYLGQLREEPLLNEIKVLIDEPEFDIDLICSDMDKSQVQHILKQTLPILQSNEYSWSPENLRVGLSILVDEYGTKKVLHPLRTSLSGQKKSLDPFSLLSILGKDESVRRINTVLAKIKP